MKIKDRSKIVNRISDRFGDRVTLVGEYYGLKQAMLFYCHDCEQWFHQNVGSLIDRSKMHSTKCQCNSGPWTHKVHRCLKEWDCYDRIKPVRGELDVFDQAKKKSFPRWRLDQL